MHHNPSTGTNALIWLWLSLLVVIVDQLTKVWVSATLPIHQPVPVMPWLNLTLLHNTGAAFSFLAEEGGWQRWFLAGLAILVSGIIIAWLTHLNRAQRWTACALALVLGGAVGNVIDRIIYGHVIDFIDFYYNHWHWPAFNLADSAISIGAVMLLIDAFWRGPTDD
jgi:signal peptidase II